MTQSSTRASRAAIRWLAVPVLVLGLLAACTPAEPEEPAGAEVTAPTEAMQEAAPMATEMEAPTTEAMPEVTGDVALMVATSMEHGDYLADGDGMALYMFAEDMTEVSTCTGTCAENWPPLIVAAAASSGAGVDAMLLGKSPRDDGSTQITYGGHPLYYYGKDLAAGETNGHDVGGNWFLVSPAGEQIPGAGG